MAKKGLAYTLNLPRKLRTHRVFYVAMLKPYRDPIHVDVEALAPRGATVAQDASSESGHPIAPPVGSGAVPAPADMSAPRRSCFESKPMTHEDGSPHEPNPRAFAPIHRTPPVLLDEQGNVQFHVEKILRKRHHHGQNQFLVKWRGYPEAYKSWEFEVPLQQDCPYAVDVYERRVQGQLVIPDPVVAGMDELTCKS